MYSFTKIKFIPFVAAFAISGFAAEFVALDEVMVTAQKRDESLRDVPAQVSVIKGSELENRNIKRIEGLNNLSANLSIFNGSGIISPSLRGIQSNSAFDNTNIAMFVDGVPYLGTSGSYIALEDINRVEILKGPQSSLYGKNAYSGVINVVSNEPSKDTLTKLGLNSANKNGRNFSFSSGGAVIDERAFLSISASRDEKDGYMKNEFLNKRDDFTKNDFAKLNLKLTPADNLKISLIQSLYSSKDGAPHMNLAAAPNPRVNQNGFQASIENRIYQNSLSVKYEFDRYLFESLTAYKNQRNQNEYDGDHTPLELMRFGSDFKVKEYIQEFRLGFNADAGKFLLGINGLYQDASRLLLMNGADLQKNDKKSKGYGIFSHNDFYLSDDLTATLGLRFDKDRIDLDDLLLGLKESSSYRAFSPKFTLSYDINDESLAYATISKGYKSGGYLLFAPVKNRRYNKESLINYEIGAKTTLSGRVNLSAAAFYMDIKNKQVMTYVSPAIAYATNAAKAQSKGFEIESEYKISRDVWAFVNLGYAKSVYKDFKDANGDYSGKFVNYAPKFTYAAGVNYKAKSGIYALASLHGQSKMFADEKNSVKTGGYALVDLKLGLSRANIDVAVYCNNLFDKKYDTNYVGYKFLSAPREFGVKMSYKF